MSRRQLRTLVGEITGKKLRVENKKNEYKKYFENKLNTSYEYDWDSYKNFTTKMIIICHVRGKFKQTPRNHSDGNGCPKCIGQSLTVLETIHEFIDEHGDIFFYDESTYINQTTKMNMYCLEHGLFMLESYLHRLGGGCPKCKNKSKGESKIYNYLDLKNIKFEEQKMFSDCRYKKPLRFDFYLPDYNICIEFDGIQHYKFNTYFHKNKQEFEEQQLRDKIKNDYCKENYIKLIRISYTERDNIEEILEENINGSK